MKTFLEIGCADFDTLIPLAARGWTGFLVEPMEKMRDSLINQAKKAQVNLSKVEFALTCISDHDGTTDMIESIGDAWASGISHVADGPSSGLLDNPGNIRFKGRRLKVPCETLDTFLDKRGISNIDFMKVDIEGHELAVFKNYSWRVKPTFLKIEHKHSGQGALRDILERKGYLVYTEIDDLYGVCGGS